MHNQLLKGIDPSGNVKPLALTSDGYLKIAQGSYTTLDLNFNSYDTFDPRIQSGRSSNATCFGSDGNLAWGAANLHIGSANADGGIPMSSTAGVDHNIVTGLPDAFGGNSAVRIEPLSGGCRATLSNQVGWAKTGATMTLSFWARSNTLPFKLGCAALMPVGGLMHRSADLTSDWQRYSFIFTMTENASWIYPIQQQVPGSTVGAGKFVEICGCQIQYGSVATPYIPTTTAVKYGPRIDYNPATLALRGLLYEGTRTNSVPNSWVQGTAGTKPTGWNNPQVPAGVTTTFEAYGVENGMPYVDIKVTGQNTSGATGNPTVIIASGIAANTTTAKEWVASIYARKIGGADAVDSWSLFIKGRSGGSLVSGQGFAIPLVGGASLSASRVAQSCTFTNALMDTSGTCEIVLQYPSLSDQATIDITLRVACPQLEQGLWASSFIPTFGAAATRAADDYWMTTTGWFQDQKGTLAAEMLSTHDYPNPPQWPVVAALSDGTSSNVIHIFVQSEAVNRVPGMFSRSGGTNQVNSALTAYTNKLSPLKVAFTWDYAAGSFRGSSAGGAALQVAAGTKPPGLNRLSLGPVTGSGWGHLTSLTYWPTPKTDSELQALST